MDFKQNTLKCGVFRYIVPFKYLDDFALARQKIDQKKKVKLYKGDSYWKKVAISDQNSESELFDHVRNEFYVKNQNSAVTDNMQGCAWTYNFSKRRDVESGVEKNDEKHIVELGISVGSDLKRIKPVQLDDAGIILYRNHVGFFWYELNYEKIKNLTADDFVVCQNHIKEFARSNINEKSFILWQMGVRAIGHDDCGVLVFSASNGIKKYVRPFFLGKWVIEQIGNLNVKFWAERKWPFDDAIRNIRGLFTDDLCKGSQWDGQTNEYHVIPDKAILFSYSFWDTDVSDSDKDNSEKVNLSYCLTNGYDTKYKTSESVKNKMVEPFSNALWFATQEGVSYTVWNEKGTNSEFFNSTMVKKAKTDYFTLYIKALYQSYSLMYYAEMIQDNNDDSKIEEIYLDINRFLTKSMATSVSHTHHQSDFYIYIKDRLRIFNDVESLTAGLDALDDIQREKRKKDETDRKEKEASDERNRDNILQLMLGFVSVLAIISAFNDWHELYNNLKRIPLLNNGMAFVVVNVIIAIVGFMAIIMLIRAVIGVLKQYGSDKNKK